MPSHSPRIERRRSQGVALITVLLIVAIVTVLSVGMLHSQHQVLEESSGLFQQDQAWLYTQGAEDFVHDLLQEDLKNDNRNNRKVDYPGEPWAQPFPPFPVEGGVINARVVDMQGRFNLNRLWHDNAPDPAAVAIFRQLLRNLGLPDTLAPAVIDWIDSDGTATDADGAEDDFYSRLDPPYRTANQPLSDVSELRLIKGFTLEIVARLKPYVCALPATAVLNVNTASATLLAAVNPELTPKAAEEVVTQRPDKGYASVDDFLGQSVFNGLDSAQKSRLRNQLDVRTHYFQLVVDAEIGGRHSVVYAVIERSDSGTLRTVARDLSQKVIAAAAVEKISDAEGEHMARQDQDIQ